MLAAAGGLPIDFLGIAAALAAGLGAPRVVHDVAGAGYIARRPRAAVTALGEIVVEGVERDGPGEGYAGSDHASLRADFSTE